MHIYIYMSMYFSDFHESRDLLCVLLWEVWFHHGRPVELKNVTSSNVVSLLWPQQTEDGCHRSKRKNTLFKPCSSDCGMTRFRAYQTLIYIMWALRLTPIYHWFFFLQNSEKCIDNILSHCAIYDWMNYVKLYSLIVLKNQCKIAELCVYRFKTAVIMCIHTTTWSCIISMLDSDTISKPWVWCMLFEHRLKIK